MARDRLHCLQNALIPDAALAKLHVDHLAAQLVPGLHLAQPFRVEEVAADEPVFVAGEDQRKAPVRRPFDAHELLLG